MADWLNSSSTIKWRGFPERTQGTPRSLLFRFSPRWFMRLRAKPNQALYWPLGFNGCIPSSYWGPQASKTCCPRSCIFYKLVEDSDTQSVHCLLYHIHTADILAFRYVQVRTGQFSGFCGLLTALQQHLSLNLLRVRNLLGLLDRGYLVSVLDCWQPLQAGHLAWCSSFSALDELFAYTKGYSSELLRWNFVSPFFGTDWITN